MMRVNKIGGWVEVSHMVHTGTNAVREVKQASIDRKVAKRAMVEHKDDRKAR